MIDDGIDRMIIFTDRSQGGTSLQDGEIELMVFFLSLALIKLCQ